MLYSRFHYKHVKMGPSLHSCKLAFLAGLCRSFRGRRTEMFSGRTGAVSSHPSTKMGLKLKSPTSFARTWTWLLLPPTMQQQEQPFHLCPRACYFKYRRQFPALEPKKGRRWDGRHIPPQQTLAFSTPAPTNLTLWHLILPIHCKWHLGSNSSL